MTGEAPKDRLEALFGPEPEDVVPRPLRTQRQIYGHNLQSNLRETIRSETVEPASPTDIVDNWDDAYHPDEVIELQLSRIFAPDVRVDFKLPDDRHEQGYPRT